METKFALSWRRDSSEGVSWFIRGIKPDASFYGEILFHSKDPAKRKATFVQDSIPQSDWPRCQRFLETFASQSAIEPRQCFASLWRWSGTSMSNGVLVYQYNLGDERDSEAARQFRELTDILEKRLSDKYDAIA
jgi:hypothetical protein